MVETMLRVAAGDGSSFGLWYHKHDQGLGRPVVLIVPAMGTEARSYQRVIDGLFREGLDVACIDLRGYGSSSVRASRRVSFGYHEIVAHDLPQALRAVRTVYSGQPLYTLGHSLGGQLLSMALACGDNDVAGVVLVASCCLHYRLWPAGRRMRVRGGAALARLITEALGYFPGKQLGFGLREGRQLMRDWEAQVRTGRCRAAGDQRDFDTLLASLSHPVLAISFDKDWLAPRHAIDGHLAKLIAAPVRHEVLRFDDAPSARSPHFRWMREPATVVDLVSRFIGAGSRPVTA